jgi:hypothetical protein
MLEAGGRRLEGDQLICQFLISGTLRICAYIFADEQIKRNRFLIFDSDQLKTKHRVFRILSAVLY